MILASTFGQQLVVSMLAVLILAVIFSIVYLVRTLGQLKRTQIHQDDLKERLAVGQRVSLNSGLIGTVVNLTDDILDLEVKSGAIIEVHRSSVHEII